MALTGDTHNLVMSHLDESTEHRTLAIDATCGKGRDTLFLATLGFSNILALDVQESAIEQSKELIGNAEGLTSEVSFICDGHQHMSDHLPTHLSNSKAQCIMFNLGYLPSADKSITTQVESTLKALSTSLQLLSPSGILSIMVYPGHDAGAKEHEAIKHWLSELDAEWHYTQRQGIVPTTSSPVLYLINRLPL
jgi:16S rRNA C1402 N4-methylase RsmH